MKIYIASDLGFTEPGREYLYGKFIPALEKLHAEILDPWKLTPDAVLDKARLCEDPRQTPRIWREVNKIIGKNNADAVRSCDILIALLDGSDVDSGTSAETGFAYALGKKILGLRTDFRISGDNSGSQINLQVEYFIHASGGSIVNSIKELQEHISDGIR